MKTCIKCEETRDLDDGFYKRSRNADGYGRSCKGCVGLENSTRLKRLKDIGPSVTVTHKDCTVCGTTQASTEYHSQPSNRDGLVGRCKTCTRSVEYERKYGITLADYDAMYEEQGGKCAICTADEVDRFHVDHCHNTGVVRGLLCAECNLGLGKFKDSTAALTAAIIYLEVHEP